MADETSTEPAPSIVREVASREPAVTIGHVERNQTWRFRAEGEWRDWFIRCGPEGYRARLLEFLDIRPGAPTAPIFALIGRVEDTGESFVIARGVEHTFATSGRLVVFANDFPSMRWNNHGAVELRAEPVSTPLPLPVPPATGQGGLWCRACAGFRDLAGGLDRTQGFLLIAAILLITGGTLALSGQGKDLVTAAVGGPERYIVWLCLATLLLGFQAWFWARAIVEFRYGHRDCWRRNPVLVWTPRVFGLIPYVFLIDAVLGASQQTGASVALPILCAVFLLLIMLREALTAHLKRRISRAGGRPEALATLKSLVLLAGLAAAAVSMACVWLDPVWASRPFGPAAVVLLAVALFIPPMILAIQMLALCRIPLTPLLLAMYVLFSLWTDNHGVRLATRASDPRTIARASLKDAYAAWRAQFPAQAKGSLPIIFVAAEGGASRAGFWTGEALSELEEQTHGAFSKHVFAISSVSGGSLGAVGFLAAIHDDPTLAQRGALAQRVRRFTAGDYLSPTLAGMLFTDFAQRFIPWPMFPDRAEALERAFEQGWADLDPPAARSADRSLTRSFLSLWPAPGASKDGSQPGRWLPRLLIGGAREEDGQRVLTSSMDFGDAVAQDAIDAQDFHKLALSDVRLSTAITNGARFYYISPAGTILSPAGANRGHIIDGGYFDASGVETARQIAQYVQNQLGGADHLRVVFLLLSNGAAAHAPVRPARIAADVLAPLLGLYDSRPALANHMDRRLWEHAPPPSASAEVYTLSICRNGVPLDWALSDHAQAIMLDALKDGPLGAPPPGKPLCDKRERPNRPQIQGIVKLLQSGP